MKFEAQQLIGSEWENTWHEDDLPLQFGSLDEAIEELQDHVESVGEAINAGEMDERSFPDLEEFRIVCLDDGRIWTVEKKDDGKLGPVGEPAPKATASSKVGLGL